MSGLEAVRVGLPVLDLGDGLRLFPAFLLNGARLIDLRDVRATAASCGFVEDGPLPADAEALPPTWRRTNRDGSPDRRVRDNPPLAVARYGELLLRGPDGFARAYLTSAAAPPAAFAKALADHIWALAGLR